MGGIHKTRKSAVDYAATIANLRGEEVFVFPVPSGTGAYAMGYRFGTYLASEKSEYEADGAKHVCSVKPSSTGVK